MHEFRDSFGDDDNSIEGIKTIVADFESVTIVTEYNIAEFESYSLNKQVYLFTSLLERACQRVFEICKLSSELLESCVSEKAGYNAFGVFIAYHPAYINSLNTHISICQKAVNTAVLFPFVSSLASHDEPAYRAIFEGIADLVSHSRAIEKQVNSIVNACATLPPHATLRDIASVLRDHYISLNDIARVTSENILGLIQAEGVQDMLEGRTNQYIADQIQ